MLATGRSKCYVLPSLLLFDCYITANGARSEANGTVIHNQVLAPEALRTLLTQLHCEQGQEAIFLGGIFAYDLIANFEQLPQVADSLNDCPDFCFYVAETLIHIDHRQQCTQLRAVAFGGETFASEFRRLEDRLNALKHSCDHFVAPALPAALPLDGHIHSNRDDKTYCADVERLKGHIRKGDIFQVVPSRCFSLPCPQPLLAYRQLKKTNPSPYMFYMNDRDFTLFGASPESAVKFEAHSRQVEMYPIAGTRRRGINADGSIVEDRQAYDAVRANDQAAFNQIRARRGRLPDDAAAQLQGGRRVVQR